MATALHIENLSKRFGSQNVLKSINLSIQPLEKIAILGANGSGKSTLLKIMAGFLYFESGSVQWTLNDQKLNAPDFVFSSPYIDLFDDLTVKEHLAFHFKHKSAYNNLDCDAIIQLSNLEAYVNKRIKQLSSGIKQRFKNTLALFSNSDVIFLDEPCSNFDTQNISIYQELVTQFTKSRMLIIASNHASEYEFICKKEFRIENCELQLVNSK